MNKVCPKCKGKGCSHCGGKGYHTNMNEGGMMNKGTKVRGQGAAIRGTKFKGIF